MLEMSSYICTHLRQITVDDAGELQLPQRFRTHFGINPELVSEFRVHCRKSGTVVVWVKLEP